MIRIFIFIAVLSLPLIASQQALADYFLWEDKDTGLTVTFPDTWKKQINSNPDDILTIMAPSATGNPMCKIKAVEDKRYAIYPAEYGRAVQKDAVSTAFWHSYMANYDDYTLNSVYDGGGLGRWLASYAFATYNMRAGSAYQLRRSVMFASLYHDTLYTVECSALNHEYDKWDNNFRSVIKSIDFKKAFHERSTGDYDDFLKKANHYFWAQTGPEGTVNY